MMTENENAVDVDVVIVGGGLSGLASAHRLHKAVPDLKVLVLEAKDRMGGRTYSVNVANPAKDQATDSLGKYITNLRQFQENILGVD